MTNDYKFKFVLNAVAAAYEIAKQAQAQLEAQQAQVKIAELQVEEAKLKKEAELESQKTFTEEYFRNRELDIQEAAATAINSSVKTIITSGEGEGYGALFGIKEVLNSIDIKED